MDSLPRYILLEKKVGETPLQALDRLRIADTRLADLPLTYAGRLDPMASGILLVLIGEECKNRTQYDKLDKEYEFEILLGAASDTGDILGLGNMDATVPLFDTDKVNRVLQSFVGTNTFAYPSYSSKTVDGKQLFQYALEGELDSIEIPKVNVTIYEMDLLEMSRITAADLLCEVEKKINLFHPVQSGKIGADFRIPTIRSRWEFLLKNSHQNFTILKCHARVTSGTYIRSLAPKIADILGCSGLAYSIHRTQIFRNCDI